MHSARPAIRISIREAGGRVHDRVLAGDRERYVIGREDSRISSQIDIQVADKYVSRRHCAVVWDADLAKWMISDLQSGNGTLIDDEPLHVGDPVVLKPGSRVRVGTTILTFGFDGGAVESDPGAATTTFDAEGATVLLASPPPGDDTATRRATLVAVSLALTGHEPEAAAILESLNAPRGRDFDADANDSTVHLNPNAATWEGTVMLPGSPDAGDATEMAPIDATRRAGADRVDDGAATELAPKTMTQPCDDAIPETIGPVDRRDGSRSRMSQIVLRGIARKLVDANYLEGAKAITLCRQARDSGRSFFREVAEDSSVKYHDEIYTLVAADLGLDLIAAETELMKIALATTWLPFTHSIRRGAVMLSTPGDQSVARYATIDPYDVPLQDWIERSSEREATRVLVKPSVFQSALQRLKNQGEDKDEVTNVLVVEIDQDEELRISTQIDKIDVPLVVNYFLQRAFMQGASDIHIEPTEDFLLVRNRVDGILHEDTTLPAALHSEISSRLKIIAGMDVAEKRRPQDGRISSLIRNNPIDVRVSSYPTIYGEKVVMRLLDKNALRPSPEHLGMFPRDLRLLYEKLGAPFGLVMISGPTGSGKTTTLYSCLSAIDKRSKNVLTVEDPVEYRLKGVHQMQVNEKIGLTFASGLRTMLRQDPDVIMVGECRDAETAGMAIQASLTGHIVFSTIHTNDAIGVITRLLDMGIDRFLVANAMTLAIAQRLVRKVCPHCRTEIAGEVVRQRLEDDGISEDRLKQLDITIDDDITYVVGTGCIHCRNTGYLGRQAVFEVFEMTNAARVAIMSPDFNADDLRREASRNGMTTLISHGLAQIEDGVTTHAEVIRVLGEVY